VQPQGANVTLCCFGVVYTLSSKITSADPRPKPLGSSWTGQYSQWRRGGVQSNFFRPRTVIEPLPPIRTCCVRIVWPC
jgi:hypothetical protein